LGEVAYPPARPIRREEGVSSITRCRWKFVTVNAIVGQLSLPTYESS
jgi:hypothetical protein